MSRILVFARAHHRLLLTIVSLIALVASIVAGAAYGVTWAAVGTGAVYLKNLPAPNTFRIDPVVFAQETSRNRKTYPALAFAGTGYGQQVNQKIDATGVVGRLLLKVTVNWQNGGTAPTATSQFPWNVLKQLTVSANGINNLFYCDGLDLRALQRVRNPFFFDRESSFTIGGNGAAWTQNCYYEIPLAFDDESLMGAVFAQTQDTTLNATVQLAASADLWSANPPTITSATATFVVEFYSIPYEDTSNGRIAIIPDLRRMHGFYAQTALLQGTSYSPLMRVNGILCRAFQRGDNAANAAGDVDWSALCTNHQFNYGSNVTPYDVPGAIWRMENEKDYGDKLLPAADFPSGAVNYIADDLVRDNALRDVIHLMGVTQPQLINIFSGLVVSNGNNSVVRTVQEHMTAGAAS